MSEIAVENLSHTFGKGTPDALTVLDDINLTFDSGSFTAIVGDDSCKEYFIRPSFAWRKQG